jgi:hypothetical protein
VLQNAIGTLHGGCTAILIDNYETLALFHRALSTVLMGIYRFSIISPKRIAQSVNTTPPAGNTKSGFRSLNEFAATFVFVYSFTRACEIGVDMPDAALDK